MKWSWWMNAGWPAQGNQWMNKRNGNEFVNGLFAAECLMDWFCCFWIWVGYGRCSANGSAQRRKQTNKTNSNQTKQKKGSELIVGWLELNLLKLIEEWNWWNKWSGSIPSINERSTNPSLMGRQAKGKDQNEPRSWSERCWWEWMGAGFPLLFAGL